VSRAVPTSAVANLHRFHWREDGVVSAAMLASAMLASYLLLNLSTLTQCVPAMWRSSGHALSFYACLLVFTAMSFGLLLMALNRYVLTALLALMVLIVTTNHLAAQVLHVNVVNDQTAEWLLSESSEASDALDLYAGPFIRYLAISLASFLPVVWSARTARRKFAPRFRQLPLAVAALLAYVSGTVVIHHYFDPFVPMESNLILYSTELALLPSPSIPSLDMQPVVKTGTDKIVLVVDESVTYGSYVTQLRGPWARWQAVDFGEAASLGNCSASSNSMLRWGFRADHMLAGEDPRLVPTVWSYARGAGYETYLIDGQKDGSYQDYMRGKEAALIDHYLGVSQGIDTDAAIAKQLRSLLREPGKRFIYVNKRGSHFPYTHAYPAERFPNARTPEQQHAQAVSYSSQNFLDIALADAALRNVLLIYTSDHGQRFDGGATHCNPVPHWQELSVPLVVVTENPLLNQRFTTAARILTDHASHAQIFPTLISAMGYDLQQAETEYGSSLLSARIPQHYFYVRGNPFPGHKDRKTVIEFNDFPYRNADTRYAKELPVSDTALVHQTR
jgi:glucan phosphoethanolaminetransferase (alkaline phosphatase superfamily)